MVDWKPRKKCPNTAIFRNVGNQPPLSLPVQEGNLKRYLEEDLTALPAWTGASAGTEDHSDLEASYVDTGSQTSRTPIPLASRK